MLEWLMKDALPDLTKDIKKYSYSIFGICCCAIHILCLMLRGARQDNLTVALGGNMKLFARTAFAAALLGSASFAGSIAPSDVQFGESGEVQASLTELQVMQQTVGSCS